MSEENTADTRTKICDSCGASFSYRVTDSTICCPYCGTAMKNEEFVEIEERKEQRTTNRRFTLIFVIVAAVVGLSFLLSALVAANMRNQVSDAIKNNGGNVNINVDFDPDHASDWGIDDDAH